MEHYVTYHKILDLCEEFQKQSPILNSFGYGNLVDFGKNTDNTTTQYPFMFMVPQSITYDENTTTYGFSILFADILNTDVSNEKDVVSDMSLEARRFLSYIKRGMNADPDLYNYMDVQLSAQAIPFQERFNDHTGGVALQANIIVFEDINACVYYEPTPTPTPTISVTPSITPSPTPSLPPSPTPSPYKMNIGDGFNEDINGFVADGNQLYAFGYFTSYNGYEAENLIRINQDGSVDSSFNSDFYKSTPNAQVFGANAQHPDYVFAWGNFLAYGNPTPNSQWGRVVKLNKTDGSLNTNFYTIKPNDNVWDVYVSGTSVWFMGNFTTWNNNSHNRFVQTDLDGNVLQYYGTAANSLIRSYVIHDDGDMVIYGDFTTWTGTAVPGIAKINLSTGALDTAFMANIGTGGAFSSKPRAIAKGASGKLYVSYPQNTWNGFAASRLVILNTDGSVDTSFSLPNSGGEAYSLLVDEANDWIYYTGTINEVGGNTRYWGRWIISTSTCDTTFTGIASRYDTINQSPYQFPYQIYKDAQGRIYLGGRFTLYYNNDTNDFDDFNRIIRVYDDGTINTQSL